MHSMFFRLGLPMVDLYKDALFDIDIVRHRPLPSGPKILASNHPSTTDPFLILEITSEPVHILIDDRLFHVPLFGPYLHLAGHIPVHPGNGKTAYRTALRKLREGKSVAIYPEGAISPLEGGFHKPRTGAARMALETGVPVVPVGVALDRSRLHLLETKVNNEPTLGTWYFRGPYAITVGAPLGFRGDVENRGLVKSVAEQIMRQITALEKESACRLESSRRAQHSHAGLRALLGDFLYD
jgi:1-acyl-sn-glycerol-3-phosphate acyltransferase